MLSALLLAHPASVDCRLLSLGFFCSIVTVFIFIFIVVFVFV